LQCGRKLYRVHVVPVLKRKMKEIDDEI